MRSKWGRREVETATWRVCDVIFGGFERLAWKYAKLIDSRNLSFIYLCILMLENVQM